MNLDGDLLNADWTKATPDLRMTRAELLAYLERTGRTMEQFMALPVYTLNRAYWDGILHG